MSPSNIISKQPNAIFSSSIYLIIANLIPIVGVAFFGLSLYEILVAYWLENIVIAFYTVLKIAMASGNFMLNLSHGLSAILFKLFIIIFFIFHFGGFTLGHGIFIFALFGPSGHFGNLSESQVAILPLAITFCLFIFSHGVSFWQNYIKNQEFRKVSSVVMMQAPYSRIMVMHLTVMGGAFVFSTLGLSSLARFIIILVKTYLDYKFHQRHHNKFNPRILNI